VNERARLRVVVDKEPMIANRFGDLVLHPYHQRLKALDQQIARYELAFGLTPLARFRLQLSYADAGNALGALQERKARAARAPKGAESAVEPEILDLDALG
jgi:hypothetical protein